MLDIHIWISQCRKNVVSLDWIQQRATKMIMGLECLSYEEWLRAGGEKPQGDIINVSKDLKLERVKMKRDSSQLHSAKEQEAIGTKWFRGYFFNKRRKVFFFYSCGHQRDVQRHCGVFIHRDIQNASGTNPGQSALVDSALSKKVH